MPAGISHRRCQSNAARDRQRDDLTKTTLQHIKSALSTIFTYARNAGAFDRANPVDGVLIPMLARGPGQTHAYDLDQVLKILDLPPASHKNPGCILRPRKKEAILVQIASAETTDTTALGGKEPRSKVYTLASGVAEAAQMRRLLCLYMS
jgi:hypothetical protein